MDHNGLLNGPSPYADTAEERPLGIEYQGGNHFVHAQNVSRSGLDQLAAQLDMMSFAGQNRQQLAMQQQQQQQQHLIQQHEHVLAQQQMNEYQQQLRRTDPVYASMTSHSVSTSSNPSPPPPNERQTPPPDTSFELAMAEEFRHMQSTSTLLKRPDLMPSRCQMHLI